jgi:hypothetical protein
MSTQNSHLLISRTERCRLKRYYGKLPTMSLKIGDLISWSSFGRYSCSHSALSREPQPPCTIDGGNSYAEVDGSSQRILRGRIDLWGALGADLGATFLFWRASCLCSPSCSSSPMTYPSSPSRSAETTLLPRSLDLKCLLALLEHSKAICGSEDIERPGSVFMTCRRSEVQTASLYEISMAY